METNRERTRQGNHRKHKRNDTRQERVTKQPRKEKTRKRTGRKKTNKKEQKDTQKQDINCSSCRNAVVKFWNTMCDEWSKETVKPKKKSYGSFFKTSSRWKLRNHIENVLKSCWYGFKSFSKHNF